MSHFIVVAFDNGNPIRTSQKFKEYNKAIEWGEKLQIEKPGRFSHFIIYEAVSEAKIPTELNFKSLKTNEKPSNPFPSLTTDYREERMDSFTLYDDGA